MIDVLVHHFRLISSLVRSGPGFNEGHLPKGDLEADNEQWTNAQSQDLAFVYRYVSPKEGLALTSWAEPNLRGGLRPTKLSRGKEVVIYSGFHLALLAGSG